MIISQLAHGREGIDSCDRGLDKPAYDMMHWEYYEQAYHPVWQFFADQAQEKERRTNRCGWSGKIKAWEDKEDKG